MKNDPFSPSTVLSSDLSARVRQDRAAAGLRAGGSDSQFEAMAMVIHRQKVSGNQSSSAL